MLGLVGSLRAWIGLAVGLRGRANGNLPISLDASNRLAMSLCDIAVIRVYDSNFDEFLAECFNIPTVIQFRRHICSHVNIACKFILFFLAVCVHTRDT